MISKREVNFISSLREQKGKYKEKIGFIDKMINRMKRLINLLERFKKEETKIN
jgi:hypothetical protein